jgi:hypothetical protein
LAGGYDTRENLGDDRGEFDMRNAANIDWISATFLTEMETDGRGVVLIFHADIFSSQAPRSNFADAITVISTSAEIFDRPVLLINGDANVYGIDHPIRDSRTGGNIQKTTRVIVFGDTELLAARVFVDPTSP